MRLEEHEYLPALKTLYRSCSICNKRTPHTCIKCGRCYSCHPMAAARLAGRQMLLLATVVVAGGSSHT